LTLARGPRPDGPSKPPTRTTRNRIARLLFEAWWTPLIQLGVIHGDPHLGNYTLCRRSGRRRRGRLNLLDFRLHPHLSAQLSSTVC